MKDRTHLYTEKGGYIFFWGGPFSQWHKAKFKDEHNREFNCCEQYMMYCKAEVFGDTESMSKVMATSSPREQKGLGRQVKGFDHVTWDKIKYNIVYLGNYFKFSQNEILWNLLDGTGEKPIAEASPWDSIWGIGLQVEDPMILNTSIWGENLLGKALMEVREELRKARGYRRARA